MEPLALICACYLKLLRLKKRKQTASKERTDIHKKNRKYSITGSST